MDIRILLMLWDAQQLAKPLNGSKIHPVISILIRMEGLLGRYVLVHLLVFFFDSSVYFPHCYPSGIFFVFLSSVCGLNINFFLH